MLRPIKSAVLLLAALCALPLPSHSKEGDPLTPVKSIPPHISVTYYPVQGESINEIELSISNNGPRDHSGAKRTAVFDWKMDWRWVMTPAGDVDLTQTALSARFLLTLPQLSKRPRDETVLFAWSRYINAVVKHELNHYRNAETCVSELKEMLSRLAAARESAPKREVVSEARQILKRCSRRDLDYDYRTRNGELEGVDLDAG